ncbi:MAG: cation diffusion facilitator family transporter [Parvularculaceae bacterium]
MTHCDHHEREKNVQRLLWAFGVIVVFMVIEVIGGVISHSLALLADATHMFTDAIALGLAASAHYIAERPADVQRPFGYRRAQVLAAFANGVLLVCLLVVISFEAVRRLTYAPVAVDASTLLIVAFFGLAANAVAFGILHTARTKNLNIRGAMLHVVNDLLGSIAAIIAAVVIMMTGWMQIDAILSLVVAVLIGFSAYKLLKETGHILLEGAPKGIDVTTLAEGVKAAARHVEDIHDVRIWQLTPEHASLTLHARINDARNAESALSEIKTYLEEHYGISQSTVQIEVGGHCPDCGDETHAHVITVAEAAQRRHAKEAAAGHGAAVFASQK